MSLVIRPVAIAAFTKGEFELLKRTAEDGDKLHDTYEDWRANVDDLRSVMLEEGVTPIEVYLTVAQIEAYCKEYGLKNIGPTRAKMVSEISGGTVNQSKARQKAKSRFMR